MPLVEYLLPEFILTYYQLTHVENALDVLHLYLEEKNYDESAKHKDQLISKGFLPEITIQDFPIRDKRVFLHIKRRRWLNTKTGHVETRDWNQVAQGTRMTQQFADFLKEIDGFIPHSTNNLGRLYGVDGHRLARQYRTELSAFSTWDQRTHAKQWLLYPQNLGPHLSLDETSLSQGELYTILTNKAAKGGKDVSWPL
ncbi:hypothetical protein GCM10028807_62460 [Spirosoma daeguense]